MKRFVAKKRRQAKILAKQAELEELMADRKELFEQKERASALKGQKPGRPNDPIKVMEVGLYKAMEPYLFDMLSVDKWDKKKSEIDGLRKGIKKQQRPPKEHEVSAIG